MYISRALEPLVRQYSENFKVVMVTGPRQAGKTTMLKHLMEEDGKANIHRAYVTLDDTALLQLAKEDPTLFMQRFHPPVLIDEIQKAPELLPAIKKIIDESDTNGIVWLTGSQPFHMMKAVSESLAGRVGILEMYGLSNAEIDGRPTTPYKPDSNEFINRVNVATRFDINQAFERICAGSLPGIRALPDELRAGGYESYISTYIMRDIRDVTQVGDELKFRRFMKACAAMTARPVVYAELARIADIDQKTAKAWLSLLVSSYVVKIVEPYSTNLIKRMSKQPILHFLDTGLAAYLIGWTNSAALETGAMDGQFFESYAFGEIYKSFANAGMKAPLYFFRTNDKQEIDLLIEQDGTLYPIEIKKTASPSKKDARHMNVITQLASDNIPSELAVYKRKIGTGCVLCMADDTYPITNQVWALPLWAI